MNTKGISNHISYSVKSMAFAPKIEAIFGLFNDRILELSNNTFSVMYAKIFKKYWHTSMIPRMIRNYCVTERQEGFYEVYIPTRSTPEDNMQYFRVAIKVLPELDRETVKASLHDMEQHRVEPAGNLDSELIVFVAPKRSEKARRERQFLRGFRHVAKRGYLTAMIINPAPEICWKRLMTLLVKFFRRRISGLLKKLKFHAWQYDYHKYETFYYRKITCIIEEFSLGIACTLRSLSHCLEWFYDKLKWTLKEIGRQSTVKMAIKKVSELETLLKDSGVKDVALVTLLKARLTETASNTVLAKVKPTAPLIVQQSRRPYNALQFLKRLEAS